VKEMAARPPPPPFPAVVGGGREGIWREGGMGTLPVPSRRTLSMKQGRSWGDTWIRTNEHHRPMGVEGKRRACGSLDGRQVTWGTVHGSHAPGTEEEWEGGTQMLEPMPTRKEKVKEKVKERERRR